MGVQRVRCATAMMVEVVVNLLGKIRTAVNDIVGRCYR